MKESSCKKMLREKAAEDRIINHFPKPFMSSATPYKNNDFNQNVKNACESDRSIRIGLKISKVIAVGDVAVGKTCLVNRFCHEVFDSNYKATIGVDFEVERFDILNTPFNLQIWDTAGQERFKCIAAAYYRGAQVIVVTFDLSNLFSLHNTTQWLDETLGNNDQNPLIFLVGTKKDIVSDATYMVVEKEAVKLAKSIKAEYWAVSSKTGENVKDFFFRVASLAFTNAVLKELEFGNSKEIAKDFVKLSLEQQKKKKGYRNQVNNKCALGCSM